MEIGRLTRDERSDTKWTLALLGISPEIWPVLNRPEYEGKKVSTEPFNLNAGLFSQTPFPYRSGRYSRVDFISRSGD